MNDYSALEERITASLAKQSASGAQFALYRKALITLRNIDPSWNAELRRIGNGASIRLERFIRGVERQQARGDLRAQALLDAIVAERVKARLLDKKSSGMQTYGRSAQWDVPSLQSLPRTARPLVLNVIKLNSV